MKPILLLILILLTSCKEEPVYVVQDNSLQLIVPDTYEVTFLIKSESGHAFVPADTNGDYFKVNTPYSKTTFHYSGDYLEFILDNRSLPSNGTVTAEFIVNGTSLDTIVITGSGGNAVAYMSGYIIDDKTFKFFFGHTGLTKREVLDRIKGYSSFPAIVTGENLLYGFYMTYGIPDHIWNHLDNDYFPNTK